MLISWNWLREYVRLDASVDEFTRRAMMAGLNHESTTPVGSDWAVDLEITSNRPDCLGHLGIAREAAVWFGLPVTLPPAAPTEAGSSAAAAVRVAIETPQLCPRYTARIIRGVRVKASPSWLVERLRTIGQPSINNVVDITNYVLFECGQPLHAFDLARLSGSEIIVREARAGEQLEAIDHRTYSLAPGMCVIADRDKPVALAGIMGGAATEVGPATVDLLIESAEFDPLATRTTARRLGLHSDSSYRFERGVDPAGVDWASRRCCQLILELAGGTLSAGVVSVGAEPAPRPPIVLRWPQIERILGISVERQRGIEILRALGLRIERDEPAQLTATPPSWRRDLEREIDLIEEVARIHGYENIPEDVRVPMSASARSTTDVLLAELRTTLVGCGYHEAMTISVVEPEASDAFSPWTDAPALAIQTPILRRATQLRRSLIPSLLAARRTNESLANPVIELFEMARAYWPRPDALPHEALLLGLTSGGDFYAVKGFIEELLTRLHVVEPLGVEPNDDPFFERGRAGWLTVGSTRLGYLGEVSRTSRATFELRGPTTVAELHLEPLLAAAQRTPRYAPIPTTPAMERDINLVVDESIRWGDLAQEIRAHGGPLLEGIEYQDTYRDPQRLGAGKKSLLFRIVLRDAQGTLTHGQADQSRDAIVAACRTRFGAELRA